MTAFAFLLSLSLQPISSTWYDYWGADYGTYGYNPYIGGVGIAVSKPPVAVEKPGSQSLSVSVSQGKGSLLEFFLYPDISSQTGFHTSASLYSSVFHACKGIRSTFYNPDLFVLSLSSGRPPGGGAGAAG